MKIKLSNFYTLLLGVFLLTGFFSCQTEDLNADSSLLAADAKKG